MMIMMMILPNLYHDQKDSGISCLVVGYQQITLLLLTSCEDLFSDSLSLILAEVKDLLMNGSHYPSQVLFYEAIGKHGLRYFMCMSQYHTC